uniref:Uncharacterized protein n=1 Tax=Steinernema glaseri TaxID=37863 RepID=A0A1I7ZIY4_9BILA
MYFLDKIVNRKTKKGSRKEGFALFELRNPRLLRFSTSSFHPSRTFDAGFQHGIYRPMRIIATVAMHQEQIGDLVKSAKGRFHFLDSSVHCAELLVIVCTTLICQ